MTERKLAPRNLSQSAKQMVILLGVILLLFAIQGIMRPGSVTVGQAMNISRQASALGVVALEQALVILGGGIDLSVGSMVTLTNVFAVSIMQGKDENILPAVAVCLLLGLLCGVVNGIGVLKLNIAPFVMTLCTMSILQGVSGLYWGLTQRKCLPLAETDRQRLPGGAHPLFHCDLADPGPSGVGGVEVHALRPQALRCRKQPQGRPLVRYPGGADQVFYLYIVLPAGGSGRPAGLWLHRDHFPVPGQ